MPEKTMKIQFVKDYADFKVGDIHETVNRKAEQLIKQGYAKIAPEKPRQKKTDNVEKADAPAPEEDADGPHAGKSGRDDKAEKKGKPDALQSQNAEK